MRFLADENVPYRVVKKLRGDGIDIISMYDVQRGITDPEVAELANQEGRILITFDKDFGTMLFVEGFTLPGLILLRFPPKNVGYIYRNLKALLSKDIDFHGKIMSVHEDRIRIGKM
ncbi:DUF5615 family PIN-like protein [Thermococcus sp.]